MSTDDSKSSEDVSRDLAGKLGGPLDDVPDLSYSMELVQQIQGGRRDALDELLLRYTPRLRRIVRIHLGRGLGRRVEIDDIVQETFVVAFQKIDKLELRSRASILQWLTKIAQNTIRGKAEYFSALKRDPRREVRYHEGARSEDSVGVQVPGAGPSPSQNAQHAEFQALVDTYVSELSPPDYRTVILLRDYQECDWDEIRDALERPTVEAAQELYRRAHLKLRERIRPRI